MIELIKTHLPETVVAVLALAATFVEVSKIKINPWTWLARTIGRALNGEVIERMDRLEERMGQLEKRQDQSDAADEMRDAIAQRARILRFGDELLHDKKHSKEHFDEILRDIKRYEAYCSTHKAFENGTTVATTQHIENTYRKLLETHGFL